MNDMTAIVCHYMESTPHGPKKAVGYYVRHDEKGKNVCLLSFSASHRWVEVQKDPVRILDFGLRNLSSTHPAHNKAIHKVRSVDTAGVRELQELASSLQQAYLQNR